MLVDELATKLVGESTTVSKIGQITLDREGLKVPGIDQPLAFDQLAMKKTGKLLDIPPKYISKCPSDLRRETMNYWFRQAGNQEAFIHYHDNNLLGIYPNDDQVVTHSEMAQEFLSKFDGDDEVRKFVYSPEIMQIDITKPDVFITVPNGERTNIPEVGDITEGGVRLVSYAPGDTRKPFVQYYLERLVCSNGLSMEEPSAKFYAKGRSSQEIIAELGGAVRNMLGLIPSKLEQYADLENHRFEGDVAQLISQVARENGLASRVVNRLLDDASSVPTNATLYDVVNVFTFTAKATLRGTTLKLQELGGNIAENPQLVTHRCERCERIL